MGASQEDRAAQGRPRARMRFPMVRRSKRVGVWGRTRRARRRAAARFPGRAARVLAAREACAAKRRERTERPERERAAKAHEEAETMARMAAEEADRQATIAADIARKAAESAAIAEEVLRLLHDADNKREAERLRGEAIAAQQRADEATQNAKSLFAKILLIGGGAVLTATAIKLARDADEAELRRRRPR